MCEEEIYSKIAQASSGFVEAPAGCGKTEAIVKAVSRCKDTDTQLVLTHTHAGVNALRHRFRRFQISQRKYHIDTIAGWSWGWARKYPRNAGYQGAPEALDWEKIYRANINLLQKNFVRRGILNSYSGVIVDEYQDCTIPMHLMLAELKNLLPCRVLGDDLQGIFGFREKLVDWSDVESTFKNNLGTLETPHRWINADNESLGCWLLCIRKDIRNDKEPDYRNSPASLIKVRRERLATELGKITRNRKGRICIIRPKAIPLNKGATTALVNLGYQVLEPNDLPILRDLALKLSDKRCFEEKRVGAIMGFLDKAYGGFFEEKEFVEKFLREGKALAKPRRSDRKKLYETFAQRNLYERFLGVFEYLDSLSDVPCKLRESVNAMKRIIEKHTESGEDLESLYFKEISKRKYLDRNDVYRCVGNTLLVKGLEFDHVVIVRSSDWQKKNWGSYKDLYVALTRGCKSVSLVELEN